MKYAVIVTYTTGEKTGATVTASGALPPGTRFLKCSIRLMCAAWSWPRS